MDKHRTGNFNVFDEDAPLLFLRYSWTPVDEGNIVKELREQWFQILYALPAVKLHNATIEALYYTGRGWIDDSHDVILYIDGNGGGNDLGNETESISAWAVVILFDVAGGNLLLGGFATGEVFLGKRDGRYIGVTRGTSGTSELSAEAWAAMVI